MKMVVILFGLAVASSVQFTGNKSGFSPTPFLEAESYVPERENYIHIGGGFFAFFNNRNGETLSPNYRDSGSIHFRLKSLDWSSRFVYLPVGDLVIIHPLGMKIELSLEKLDYIKDAKTGRSFYRLTARNAEFSAALIAETQGYFGAGTPKLEGYLFVRRNVTPGRITVSQILVIGRNENEAERHLNRVVEAVSDFQVR